MAVRMLTYLRILLFACLFYQTGAIECYMCMGTNPLNPCLHIPSDTQTTRCKETCSLEVMYKHTTMLAVIRGCYNKTALLLKSRYFKSVDAETNLTVVVFRHTKVTLSASICNTNYCNGPNSAPPPRLHSPTLLVAPTFTILLPYVLSLTGLL